MQGRRIAWSIALAAGVLTVLYRIAPYYWLKPQQGELWNLMPVGALALFAGARLRSVWGALIPLAAMVVSDLLLIGPISAIDPTYNAFGWTRLVVYPCFAAYFLLGLLLPQSNASLVWAVPVALAGSLQFFLITNFASWWADGWADGVKLYSPGIDGLWQSYVAALPFHRGTLIGDLVFTPLLFGLHALAVAAAERPQPEGQPA
jgi:hypothetical protein